MLPEGIVRLFQSRKFWVLIAAVITAVGSYLGGLIDALAMVQLVIAALAVYSTGIAIVDSGVEVGKAEVLRQTSKDAEQTSIQANRDGPQSPEKPGMI